MKSPKTYPIKNSDTVKETGTSKEVLEYYERNWEQITKCYDIGADELPIDPAFYRRRIYLQILQETKANNILDIGCGGGRTVLDALEMGRKVRGVEPIEPLVRAAKSLLAENNKDPELIKQGDLADVKNLESDSFDTIAALSVLPHVEQKNWDRIHQDLARLVKEGGYFIASYRNDLFDMYTFNRFTIDFFANSLWNCPVCKQLDPTEIVNNLKGLIQNPDIPEPSFTRAKDASFGKLTRVNSNPLEMSDYLSKFDLELIKTYFFNYHCVPPLMAENVQDYRTISHQMNMEMSENWRGYFMTSTFLILARKKRKI